MLTNLLVFVYDVLPINAIAILPNVMVNTPHSSYHYNRQCIWLKTQNIEISFVTKVSLDRWKRHERSKLKQDLTYFENIQYRGI